MSWDNQLAFTSAYVFFNFLRNKLEATNLLILQFSMALEDARGFTFADTLPLTIVVNSKDLITARIFTLMHEFGHILLGETIIDLPMLSVNTKFNTIERWCNNFAASFLLPKEPSRKYFIKFDNQLTKEETLTKLSRKLKLSKTMLLYNMYKLDFITYEQFLIKYQQYQQELKQPKTKSSGGSISIEKRRLSELGSKFISLVATNYDTQQITFSDALSHLSIKAKNYEKLLAKAEK